MKRLHSSLFRRSFIALPLIVLSALLVLWFTPYFQVSKVVLHGNTQVSTDEIMLLLDEPVGKPLIKMYTEPIQERLMLHPWVLKAKVLIRFPDTMEIQLEERKILLYLPYYGSFLAVAADGTSLDLSTALPKESLLFTGVDLPFLALGEKIPHCEFLKNLDILIQKMNSSVRLMIGEIELGSDGFFYLQTTDNYQMRVDATVSEQQFLDIRAIILFMREQGVQGTVILQDGTPVFIPNE
jgi:cell division protein FtsQ